VTTMQPFAFALFAFGVIFQATAAPCNSASVCPDFDDQTVFKLTGPEAHSGAPFRIVLSQVDQTVITGFLLFASNEEGARVGSFTLLPGTQFGSNCSGSPAATLTHNKTLAWGVQEILYTPSGSGPVTFKGVAVTESSCNQVDSLVVPDETQEPTPEPTDPQTGAPEEPTPEPTDPQTDAPVDQPTAAPTDNNSTDAPVTLAPGGSDLEACLRKHDCMNTTQCNGIRRTYWESYCKMEALLPMWAWIAILSVGAVLILIFFICCCVCCCRKKDPKDEAEFGLLGNQ
jgi:hypothetical protein